MILWSTCQGEMDQRGEGWSRWQRPVWGLLQFLAGTTWTTLKLQHFPAAIPSACPQVLRGRRETLPITKSEVSTPPTIVNETTSEWLYSPHTPPTPLPLFTILWFVFDWGSTRLVLSPLPTQGNCTPEVFMGSLTGCSAHQEIKVSSSSKMCRCSLWPFQL